MPSKKRPGRITQALPDARIIPRIRFLSADEKKRGIVQTDKKIDPEVAEELSKTALKAYNRANQKKVADYEVDNEPIAVILAPILAANAASHFVGEKAFETSLLNFRAMVANEGKPSIKRAITNLLEKMPADGEPPFPQMRNLYCSAGGSEEEWQRNFDPTIVREALTLWIELMGQLHGMNRSRRPPITAEKQFVGALAHYWTEELGARLGNSRSDNQPKEYDQKGLFADFVRKAAEIIPKSYRPASWDHAIREILGSHQENKKHTVREILEK